MIALISASVGAIAVICDARLHAVCRFVSSSSLACLQTMGVGGFRLWHPSLCGIRHSYFSDSAFSADRISFGRRVQERGQGWMLLESQGGIGNPPCAAVRTREVAPHVGLRWVLQKSKTEIQESRVRGAKVTYGDVESEPEETANDGKERQTLTASMAFSKKVTACPKCCCRISVTP